MSVGQIVHETLTLARIYSCNHNDWIPINDTEERCKNCRVIATQHDKENLKRIKEGKQPVTEIRI